MRFLRNAEVFAGLGILALTATTSVNYIHTTKHSRSVVAASPFNPSYFPTPIDNHSIIARPAPVALASTPEAIATIVPTPTPPVTLESPMIWIRNDYDKAEGFKGANDADIMGLVPKLGIGGVRIDIGGGDFFGGDGIDTRPAIKRAQDLGLGMELVYNPQRLVTPAKLKTDVASIVSGVRPQTRLLMDASNEVDNKTIPFWTNGLDTYPVFAVMLKNEFDRQRPGTEIVISATVNPYDEDKILSGLIRLGANPEDFLWAIHIYGGVADVNVRTKILEDTFSRHGLRSPRIIYDETGVDAQFVESVEAELQYNPALIVAHELTYKPWKEEKYGLIRLDNQAPNPRISLPSIEDLIQATALSFTDYRVHGQLKAA